MIKRLIGISVEQRLLVILLAGFLCVAGVDAFFRLPIDAVPDLTNTQVQILTTSPSLSPQEIEKQITFPIEQAMAGIPKLEEIRSLSQLGLSVVTAVFVEGTDLDWARQQINQRLAVAREEIPSGLGTPMMGPMATGLSEIFQFEIRSEKRSQMALRTLLDWSIAPPLRTVTGVIEVNALGGLLQTYEVQLRAEALRLYKIGVHEIHAALQASNQNVGGGSLQQSGEQAVIRGEGIFRGIREIESLAIRSSPTGEVIRLHQVGRVKAAPMIRQGTATRDGRGEVVTATVMMLAGANAREVAGAIRERLDQLQKTLPADVRLDVFYDRAELVQRTIRTVAWNLGEGGLLVILILFLLLGDLRGGLLVALVIPLSMLFALICMNRMGLSGNLMSLGAIDFGLIVDGAVVMTEHALLFLVARQAASSAGVMSLAERNEAIKDAGAEVGRPIVFSFLIIILVYLPILTLEGSEGKLFRPMAWTLIFALSGALLLSLTLIPALLTFFSRFREEKPTLLMRFFRWLYEPLLRLVLRFRRLTLSLAFGVFLMSLVFASCLGADFLPRLDEGMLALQAQRLASISLEESIKQAGYLEKLILTHPEIKTVISKIGRPEIATDPMGLHQSDIYIGLHPKARWRSGMTTTKLIEEMKGKLEAELPGAEYSFSQPIEMRTAELLEGIKADIGIKIFGDDLEKLQSSAQSLRQIIQGIRGAGDVGVEMTAGLPYLRIRLHYDKLGYFGLTAAMVNEAIQAIGGKPSGDIYEGTRRIALRLRFHEDDRKSLDALRNLPLVTPRGAMLRLQDVADLWIEGGALQIQREQGRRRILVLVNVRGRDLASFVSEAQKKVDEALQQKKIAWTEGYYLEWSGQFKHLQSATKRLVVIVPLTLVMIFVILLMAFGSVPLSFLIYLNVPIAITGGIFALLLRGMPFSISAAVGFIALFGIAVMNGVVLVSAIRHNEENGLSTQDAVWQGATGRLRPVLMTALTDAIGFLPMALSTSAGAEVQKPLATVVIGGVFTSMFLTLFILPAAYALWFEKDPQAPKE
jgi:cobalt-zinc-cadmium resistance protein CzcA